MSNPGPARRRPHPAHRARKLAGSLSIATLFALTGCMAATTKPSATPTAAAANPAATTTTGTTGTTTTDTPTFSFGDDDSMSSAAVPGTASSQSVTSTHAS